MPFRSTRLIEGASYATPGALVESTIHGRWPVRFTTEIVEVSPGSAIRVDYVAGSFRGTGLWAVDGAAGGTKLSYRWPTSPTGTLRVLAPFLPVEKSHSHAMQAAFRHLNEFLA